jgi:hypothetical protein
MKKEGTLPYSLLVHHAFLPLPFRSLAYLDAYDILCANFQGKDKKKH